MVNNTFLERIRLNTTFETRAVFRIFLIFLGMVILATVLSRGVFLQSANLVNLVNQNTILMLVALGQLLVILTGGIDLSVGAVHAIASVVMVLMADQGLPLSLLIVSGVGMLFGAFNGALVTVLRIPSFVVTLGTMQIVSSLAMVVSKGGTVYTGLGGGVLSGSLTEFFKNSFLGFPYPILLALGAILLVGLYLHTSYGYFTIAVGGNRRAAFLAGIPVRHVEFAAYLLVAVIAAVSGALFVGRVGLGDPQAGRWLNLDSIAAVSIGGASLAGGVGNVFGTTLGVLIIGVLNNIMNLLGVPPELQPAIKGLVILLAVFINSSKRGR